MLITALALSSSNPALFPLNRMLGGGQGGRMTEIAEGLLGGGWLYLNNKDMIHPEQHLLGLLLLRTYTFRDI